MTAFMITAVVGTLATGLLVRVRWYAVAAAGAVFVVCMCLLFGLIWLANENMRDHAFYAQLIICRMTDRTGECP